MINRPPPRQSETDLLASDILRNMYSRNQLISGVFALALGVAITHLPRASAQTPRPWPLKIEPAQISTAAGSNGPQLTSSAKGVIASWLESGENGSVLKFVERTTAGWSKPATAASGDDWFVTEADTPAVLRLSNGVLVASWEQSTNEEVEASNLRLSYSKDNGKTWAPSFLPHHDGTDTQHGFATLFELPGPALGVVWLDGRLTVKDREHGPMTLRYGAFNAQWRQQADTAIDTKVCDCCTTSVAMTSEGPIVVYRDRSDDEIRDIYVSRLVGGKWTTGTAVHNDGWQIKACPINGPVVSAHDRDVAVAWYTMKNEIGQAFVAFSSDAGKTFGQPIRLDDAASLGKVDIEMLDDGSAVASWIEFADRRQFRVRRVERSGAKSAAFTIAGAAGGRVGGVPRLARQADQLVFAWTETPERGGTGQVRIATAGLPR